MSNNNNSNGLSVFERIEKMKAEKKKAWKNDRAISTNLHNKKASKGITLDVVLMSKDDPKSVKNGKSYKSELYISNLNCKVPSHVGRHRKEDGNIVFKLLKKVRLTQEEKDQGNYDSKALWKYVDVGKEHVLKKNDTIRCNFYASIGSPDIPVMDSAKNLSLIRVFGLRPLLLVSEKDTVTVEVEEEIEEEVRDDETGEVNTVISKIKKTKEVPKEILVWNIEGVTVIGSAKTVFETLNPIIPRISNIPKITTELPSDDRIMEYLDKNVIYIKGKVATDAKKKRSSALNALFKADCTNAEKNFMFGTYWIKTHPEKDNQIKHKLETDDSVHIYTTFCKFKSVKENETKMTCNVTLDVRQWNVNRGSTIENPEKALLLVSTFDKQSWKFLGITDPDKWEVLAPLHLPKIECLLLTWPALEDTSALNEIESNDYDVAIKFGCSDIASDLVGYLVRDHGGYPVSADYVFDRLREKYSDVKSFLKSRKDREIAYFSELFGDNIANKEAAEEKNATFKIYHKGILATLDTRTEKIPKDDDDITYYSLSNFLLNEEQIEIYKAWDPEDRKARMSDILMKGKESEYAGLLKIEEFPETIVEEIYIMDTNFYEELLEDYAPKEEENGPIKVTQNGSSSSSSSDPDPNPSKQESEPEPEPSKQEGDPVNSGPEPGKEPSNNDNEIVVDIQMKDVVPPKEEDDATEPNPKKSKKTKSKKAKISDEDDIDIHIGTKRKKKRKHDEQVTKRKKTR